ncbi:LuxQ periplasmic sensor domain-containing protein, partial [Vibrio rotiferianus]
MATLITRIIVVVLAPIIFGIFVQSYYFSKQIIWQEVDRNKQQTSSLIHNIFDNHFAAIQIHHDSNSKSEPIRDFYSDRNAEMLNYFYLGIDQSDPSHTPEFRFLTDHHGIIWDDGNAHFYGVNEVILEKMSKKISFSSNWYYMNVRTLMGQRHMLLRRVPVINTSTGEVLGYSFISIVLDNNFSLMEKLKSESNVDNVLLIANNEMLANSFDDEEDYSAADIIARRGSTKRLDKLLVIETPIMVNASMTELCLLSVQDNQGVVSLQIQHVLAMLASIIGLLMIALMAKEWMESKVAAALDTLMSYTKSASDEDRFKRFVGSDIEEFNHIGSTLESTFEELDSQKKSFRDLFNFALSPIMVWSESAVLIQMNPAAKRELVIGQGNTSLEAMHPVFQKFKEKLTPHLKMSAQGATL